MARIGLITFLLITVLMGCLIATTARTVAAQQVNFSLAVGEEVTVGSYILKFEGLADRSPSYTLYALDRSVLANFVSDPAAPYMYQDIYVITNGVTPDGMVATGTITVK